ncbi:MAG: UbiA family prenyltransferase [Candidatus Omnitrophota bacterium]|nr:UbiA family prenyltransferase [Candidatus Omnitrophota bacterium]
MIHRLKIYLELIRPFTLIAPMVGFLSGAIIASGAAPNIYCFLGALSAAILNAASNVNNQYFDLEIDKVNKPFRPLPSGKISKMATILFACMLYCISLALSLFINLQLFFIILITAVITFFYSAPPLRIKQYPFMSNIAIALPRGMFLIVAGWSAVKSAFNIEPWFIGLIFALYLTGAATTKDFSDIKGDSQFGIKTLPILYGPEKAAKIISPFLYIPFMLIPLGVIANIIKLTALPLTLLVIWGLYTAKLITKRPQDLTLEQNHISWKHMYLMLIAGQVGFAIAYLIKI